MKSVAAVSIAIKQSKGIVMEHALIVFVPHSVEILLMKSQTQHLTNSRLTKYEEIILASENIQIKRCLMLNPATLLPSLENYDDEDNDYENDCNNVTELCTKPRPVIKEMPIEGSDLTLFVDESCLRDNQSTLRAAYSVCTLSDIIEASYLNRVSSAQVAEIIALTRACCISENLKVPIYTDSQYSFGIVHNYRQIWQQRGFLTYSGTPIKNVSFVADLLEPI